MSQHDQNVANDTAAAVRADINAALVALFSISSGATAPSTTVAYQLWADTTNDLLKQRNAANSGWITRGTISTGLAADSSKLLGSTWAAPGALGSGTPNTGAVTSLSAIIASTSATVDVQNTHASNPRGQNISYTLTAPNGTTNEFLYCQDSSAVRFVARSNGGLANFSANDVNLCDARAKSDFQTYSEAQLDELEAAFVEVDWGTGRYANQTHADPNHFYTAQGVQRAFGNVAPELVDVWNEKTPVMGENENGKPAIVDWRDTPKDQQLLCVYHEDLKNIGNALLARALVRVRALEQRLFAKE